jgi:hypothetical protein
LLQAEGLRAYEHHAAGHDHRHAIRSRIARTRLPFNIRYQGLISVMPNNELVPRARERFKIGYQGMTSVMPKNGAKCRGL